MLVVILAANVTITIKTDLFRLLRKSLAIVNIKRMTPLEMIRDS